MVLFPFPKLTAPGEAALDPAGLPPVKIQLKVSTPPLIGDPLMELAPLMFVTNGGMQPL